MKRAFVLLSLLVSWSALADGMIVIPGMVHQRTGPSVPSPFPLAVKYHRVDVTIKDAVAWTSIDQEFFQSHRRGWKVSTSSRCRRVR